MSNTLILIINTSTAEVELHAADDAIPAGWIAADGSTVNGVTTYPQLGSLISTRYGGTARSALTLPSGIPSSLISGLTTAQQAVLSQTAGNPLVNATSTAETDLFGDAGTGYSLAGGTLSTIKQVRISVLCEGVNSTGGALNTTLKIYYGSTNYSITASISNSSTNQVLHIEGFIAAAGATNAQRLFLRANTPSGLTVFALGVDPSAAIDSTTAQPVRVTCTNAASLTVKSYNATLELIG